MPLFNPPLPKFGNKKCSHCGQPVKWTLFWFGDFAWRNSPWVKWSCPKCQSILGWNLGRAVMWYGLLLAVLLPSIVLGAISLPYWWLGWATWCVGTYWWLYSVVVRRPAEGSAAAS